jgi:DNA-binding NtrC family response regulator
MSHQQRIPTVLVIDDFDPFARVIRHILARRGFSVLCATTSDESLALLEAQDSPIDLVVIDLVSPEAGNLDLSAALERRRPRLPPVLYLFGSRHGMVQSVIKAQAPGAALVAPFTEHQLLDRVEHLSGEKISSGEMRCSRGIPGLLSRRGRRINTKETDHSFRWSGHGSLQYIQGRRIYQVTGASSPLRHLNPELLIH